MISGTLFQALRIIGQCPLDQSRLASLVFPQNDFISICLLRTRPLLRITIMWFVLDFMSQIPLYTPNLCCYWACHDDFNIIWQTSLIWSSAKCWMSWVMLTNRISSESNSPDEVKGIWQIGRMIEQNINKRIYFLISHNCIWLLEDFFLFKTLIQMGQVGFDTNAREDPQALDLI